MTAIQLSLFATVVGITYIVYKSAKPHSAKYVKDPLHLENCPLCNRFEEPVDQYGHCSNLCSALSMGGPYN
jgi:hypothetical protein